MRSIVLFMLLFIGIPSLQVPWGSQEACAQDARKITEKYLNKLGGKWRLRKLQQIFLQVDVTINEVQFEAHIYHKNASLYKQILLFRGDTVQKQIYNNGKVFISSFNTQSSLSDKQIAAFRHQAYIFPELAMEEDGYQLSYEGQEYLHRIKTHKIRVSSPSGYTFHLWYHHKTHMRVRSRYPVGKPGKEAYHVYDIMQYRKIKGLQLPVYKRIATGDGVIVMKLNGIRFPDLSKADFQIPVQ